MQLKRIQNLMYKKFNSIYYSVKRTYMYMYMHIKVNKTLDSCLIFYTCLLHNTYLVSYEKKYLRKHLRFVHGTKEGKMAM